MSRARRLDYRLIELANCGARARIVRGLAQTTAAEEMTDRGGARQQLRTGATIGGRRQVRRAAQRRRRESERPPRPLWREGDLDRESERPREGVREHRPPPPPRPPSSRSFSWIISLTMRSAAIRPFGATLDPAS
mmetsp:Transcript_126362/g.365802  ORF Transcript_126362/g.365802 Transcript_126362/m.365802 type:complete len:135 (-) Transcript_126362:1615-2019(-)